MKITIKTLQHRYYHVEIKKTSRVRELKLKLTDIFLIPSNYQRLIYNGKWLDNEDGTLEDYKIEKESLIYLSVPQGSRPQMNQSLMVNYQTYIRNFLIYNYFLQ